MKKVLALFVSVFTMALSNPSWALEAHFSNDTDTPITIHVQGNNCVTYLIQQQTYTVPAHTSPSGWIMNLGDRNSGGCSASYMLAWGIYQGTTVDPAKKIGDVNFHYQSGVSVSTWQNLTKNTGKYFNNFHICSNSEIKNNSWSDSHVWWHFGAKYSNWDCKAPVN